MKNKSRQCRTFLKTSEDILGDTTNPLQKETMWRKNKGWNLTGVKSHPSVRRRLEVDLQSVLDFTRSTIVACLAEELVSVSRDVGPVPGEAPAHSVDRMVKADAGRIGDIARVAGQTTGGEGASVAAANNRVAAELHLVEEVEELHAELHVDAFGHLEVLQHGKVGVGNPRSRAGTDVLIAKCVQLEVVHGESPGVPPL